jgi:hypothetical protein
LSDLLEYGPLYLTKRELETRVQEVLSDYYRFLAINALERAGQEFWRYHVARLRELGCPISKVRLGAAVLAKSLDLALNPKQTVEKVFKRINGKHTHFQV